MSGLPVMTLLAAPATASVSGVGRGRGGDETGTRFGAALALAELELPVLDRELPDAAATRPASGDDATDASTPVAAPEAAVQDGSGTASTPVGATAPLFIAPSPGETTTAEPSAGREAAPPADPSDSAAAAPLPAEPAAASAGTESAEPAFVADVPPRPDAAPRRATVPTVPDAAAGPGVRVVSTASAAPEAFQPAPSESPSNPPELPTAPPTLAPHRTADAGPRPPAHGTSLAAPAVAPVVATSAPPAAPVEASDSSSATPRAVAAQVSPAVIAIAQRPSGTHRLTMTVHPESLGPVTVRAHIGVGGDVQVELLGATDAGRDALRAIVADLRRDLGAVMPNASLSLASSTGGEAGAQDRGAQPGIGGREGDQPGAAAHHSGDERAPRAASSAADQTVPATAHVASGAGLDIFV